MEEALLNYDAIGGDLGVRTFTKVQQYRLRPKAFHALGRPQLEIMIGEKVKGDVGKDKSRRTVQN